MSIHSGNQPARSAVHDHNRRAWNASAVAQRRFTKPISDKEFQESVKSLDADGWFEGRIPGARLLCLGSGGGRQSILYAAAGAAVTVVDISDEMLRLDRLAAAERGYDIRAVEASIDDLTPLPSAAFDIVVHPVSTCYVPDVVTVYRQIARVTVPGGIYISQHKQPASLQASVTPSKDGYELTVPYYVRDPLPPVAESPHREEGTLEFLHNWQNLIGGLCQSGFVVEDVMEPVHAKPDATKGTFAHRSAFAPPYVRIKARRVSENRQQESTQSVVLTFN